MANLTNEQLAQGTLTETQLKSIEARAAKATDGKFRIDYDHIMEWHDICVGDRKIAGDISRQSDAEFIAHARQDIPALCAALREAWADLSDANHVMYSEDARMERLSAENERLREALQKIADIDDWDYGLEYAKDITFATIKEPEGWGGWS